jgi:N-acetylglucosamine-6-sulfatase
MMQLKPISLPASLALQTGHFGKLINDQNYYWCPTKKDPVVTTGFDHISTSCESTGAYWATQYINKAHAGATVSYETLANTSASTYSTAQFGNRSTQWIQQQAEAGQPFFAYIGLMGRLIELVRAVFNCMTCSSLAPHLPAWPAPWYQGEFANVTAPRTPSYNVATSDRYELVANASVLDRRAETFIDKHMSNRWKTLLSVDDVVDAVFKTLAATNTLNNTYVFYTSDHVSIALLRGMNEACLTVAC